jgi:pilus assembly protein CpaF
MASMYSDSVRAFLRPILPFLDDPTVNEVVVNGPAEIWIERNGRLERTNAQFSEEGLLAACRNIAQFIGRTLNDEKPRLDARLPDGSRIHIVLPPIALRGTILAVRKFMRDALSIEKLVELGTLTPAAARLLDAVINLRLNVIIAGGTGSGKTSLLNLLSGFIDPDERIVTIEDSAELQIQQTNVIGLEARPGDKFGKGEVTLSDLLNSALRLRPDRILVGEVRGGECFSLLQAMNTGHSGSMATTHASSPLGTMRRLESLALMSGIELPLVAVRAQVASAVNIIICLARMADGSRKITHVSEALPLDERGDYRVQDLFVYTQTGRNADTQAVEGFLGPTGVLPTFFSRLHAIGADLPDTFFDPVAHRFAQPPVFTAGLGDHTQWAPSIAARLDGAPPPEIPEWSDEPRLVRVPAIRAPAASEAAKKERSGPPTPPPRLVPAAPPAPEPPRAPEPPPPPPVIARPPRPAAPIPVTPRTPRPAASSEGPTIQIAEELLRPGGGPGKEATSKPRSTQDDKTDPNIRLR